MTKHARKAGNIIFVLVISFLLIMGCLFASDTIKDKTDNTNLDNMANTLQTTADVTYTLPGNFSDNERIWNEAVQYSQNNGTINVLVKLNGNWTAATDSSYRTSFGLGIGFSDGRIYVPSGVNIILDLNGKTIDRGLSSQRSNGSVILVEGTLRLIDSGFDSATIYNLDDTSDAISKVTSGRITGGYSDNGGGVIVDGGKFYMYGGAICKNKAINGGGIIGVNIGSVYIYDGIIAENQSSQAGGGIYNVNNNTTYIYGGHIYHNYATYGGGIYSYENHLKIYGGKISYNRGSSLGGGIYLYCLNNSSYVTKISNCIISNNSSGTGGGINLARCLVTLDGVEIINNKASSGSAISNINPENKITLKNTIIMNNETTNKGYYAIQTISGSDNFEAYISIGNKVLITNNINSAESKEKNLYVSNDSSNLHRMELLEYAPESRIGITPESNFIIDFYSIASSQNDLKTIASIFYNVEDGSANGSAVQKYGPGQFYRFNGDNRFNTSTYWEYRRGGLSNFTEISNSISYVEVPYTGEEYEIRYFSGNGMLRGCSLYVSNLGYEFSGSVIDYNIRDAGIYIITADMQVENNDNLTSEHTLIFRIMPQEIGTFLWGTNTFVYDGQFHKVSLKVDYDDIRKSEVQTLFGGVNVGIGINFTNGIILSSNGKVDNNRKMPLWNRVKTFTITPKPIDKPIEENKNILVFNSSQQTYLPSGYDSSQMVITGNKNTDVGEYTAKVTPNSNHKWSDNTTTAIEFKYKIIPAGVLVKEGVKYDYQYIDSNNIRQFYGNSYMHKLNDENLNIVNGVSKYVLGNIPVNTSIEVFLNNLQSDRNLIKIYAKESDITPIYDGLIGKRSDLSQTLATGFKVELYSNSTDTTPFDTIYLSVLGDINGDGRINASDVSYLRQVANDSTLLESMPLERQLACMINNKGGITEVDSEILRNYIGKEIDLEKFMESETANTNNTYTYLTLDRDNMLRKTSESKTNVIGNISVNTSVETLKSKLAEIGINISAITIYNRKGDEVSNNTAIVGTGWRIEVGGEVTYLSVLGDLTGDGRITAADISYLRAIAASDTTNVQDCILLSAILLNKGGITTADSEVLKLVINNKISIDKY